MDGQTVQDFQWLSPLGISVILFLVWGILYIFIGVLTPIFINNLGDGPMYLIVSTRTDTIVFGQPPIEIWRNDLALAKLRTILLIIMGGLLFLSGCFELTITWFGLKQGQSWALIALAIGGFGVLPFWFIALRPYLLPGVNLTLWDVLPLMWIPAALLLPALALGWIGLS